MRRCLSCGEVGTFYASNTTTCSTCIKKRVAEWRRANPGRVKEARVRSRQRRKLRVALLEALTWRLITSDAEGAQRVVEDFEDQYGLEPGSVMNSLWRPKKHA